MQYFAGIDVGTSGVKVVLINEKQLLIESVTQSVTTNCPRPGWSEQDPEDWWSLVCRALSLIREKRPDEYKKISGVGVTGQMHGMVIVDANYTPLRSAILWNDARAAAEARELHTLRPDLAAGAGVMPMAGLTAPKLLWLKNHEPTMFERIHLLLSVKDYINLKLTGRVSTDYSDAAGSWFLDQQKRCWSLDAIELTGLTPEKFPPIIESSQLLGTVSSEAAALTALPETAFVVGGGGDTPVGAVGMGCVRTGQAEISLGTSAHVLVCNDCYSTGIDQLIHSFCHAVPGLWYEMAAMLNGASTLSWVASVLGRSVVELEREVEASYSGPGSLIFLPYLAGERTPHNNPDARGAFFGLSASSCRKDMVQAVMEGVAYSLADGCECLAKTGVEINSLMMTGGGAKSRTWAQMIATILNKKIIRVSGKDAGPAFGAARLAMVGTGVADFDDFILENDLQQDIFMPDHRYSEHYQQGLEKFRRLYKSTAEEF